MTHDVYYVNCSEEVAASSHGRALDTTRSALPIVDRAADLMASLHSSGRQEFRVRRCAFGSAAMGFHAPHVTQEEIAPRLVRETMRDCECAAPGAAIRHNQMTCDRAERNCLFLCASSRRNRRTPFGLQPVKKVSSSTSCSTSIARISPWLVAERRTSTKKWPFDPNRVRCSG